MKHPLIIAHRGSSAEAPENTLAAFDLAIRDHADGVEMDVWQCASGELVVTHNRKLEILTGRAGDIEKFNLSQLRELDFGAFKGKAFRGEKIPTLEEVLDLVKRMTVINIEVKGKHIRGRGMEEALVAVLKNMGLLQRAVVSSFNPFVLYRLRRLEPGLLLGLIFHRGSALPLRRAWARHFLSPYSLHPEKVLLNSKLVGSARQKNQKVFAWTVNNIHDLERCVQLGIDGIITDEPAAMKKGLNAHFPKG